MTDYESSTAPQAGRSAREVVGEHDRRSAAGGNAALPAAVLWQAREHDMDFGQFCILFRSIFLEGLARPLAGVRLILKNLVRQVQGAGRRVAAAGRRRRRSASTKAGRTASCWKTARNWTAEDVLSSAGWRETHAAVRRRPRPRRARAGRTVVRRVDLGPRTRSRTSWDTIARWSFSTIRERFHYEKPRRAGRSAQRHRLLAEQLCLRRAAGRGHVADHGAGQLRPLGGARRARTTG